MGEGRGQTRGLKTVTGPPPLAQCCPGFGTGISCAGSFLVRRQTGRAGHPRAGCRQGWDLSLHLPDVKALALSLATRRSEICLHPPGWGQLSPQRRGEQASLGSTLARIPPTEHPRGPWGLRLFFLPLTWEVESGKKKWERGPRSVPSPTLSSIAAVAGTGMARERTLSDERKTRHVAAPAPHVGHSWSLNSGGFSNVPKFNRPGTWPLTHTGQASPGSLQAAPSDFSPLLFARLPPARGITLGSDLSRQRPHWGMWSRVTPDIFSAWCQVRANPRLVSTSFPASALSLPTTTQSNLTDRSLNSPYTFWSPCFCFLLLLFYNCLACPFPPIQSLPRKIQSILQDVVKCHLLPKASGPTSLVST